MGKMKILEWQSNRKILYCGVILISFHFAHASMIITVDNQVTNNLIRIYLNVYYSIIN